MDSTLERGDLRGERGEAGSSSGNLPGGLGEGRVATSFIICMSYLRASCPSSRVILLLVGS